MAAVVFAIRGCSINVDTLAMFRIGPHPQTPQLLPPLPLATAAAAAVQLHFDLCLSRVSETMATSTPPLLALLVSRKLLKLTCCTGI